VCDLFPPSHISHSLSFRLHPRPILICALPRTSNVYDFISIYLISVGIKKRGFGCGKINGFGGKIEQGETNEEAAKRELLEESSVTGEGLKRVGFLKFFMTHIIMNVHVYTCYEFSGECEESDEMKPMWVNVADIDYDKMWSDDRFWLPLVLKGKCVLARYEYESDDETIADGETTEQ